VRIRGLLAKVAGAAKERARIPLRRAKPVGDKIARLWANEALPSPIGRAGYTLPALQGASVISLGDDNWIVACRGAQSVKRRLVRNDAGVTGNILVLGRRSRPPKSVHFQGSNGVVIIGDDILWPNLLEIRLSSDDEVLFWGRGATSNGTSIILEGHGQNVVVGDDCMFAAGTALRTSDLHGIVDLQTERWLNPPASILIGPHVWVGQDAMILKGVSLGASAIIGAKSLVNKNIPPCCLAAGAPARVLRTEVSWDRERQPRPSHVKDIVESIRPIAR